jgi:hypothetical protein
MAVFWKFSLSVQPKNVSFVLTLPFALTNLGISEIMDRLCVVGRIWLCLNGRQNLIYRSTGTFLLKELIWLPNDHN